MSNADSLRGLVRRLAPAGARRMVFGLREAIGQPPVDDVVLAQYRFAPDPAPGARLTLVLPNIHAHGVFGGLATGSDIVIELAKALGADALRIILTDVDSESDPGVFVAAAARLGFPAERCEALQVRSARETIAVRAAEIFVTYNWWTTLNVQPLIAAQAAHFGRVPLPLVYLIQDYEPHLVPFSSAAMLSRDAYDAPARLWGVFNSGSLERYFRLQGHACERAFVFEPVISGSLRPSLPQVAGSVRAERIVIYGRERVPRNCFPALARGLRRWAADYPEFRDWEVVSAGMPHAPIALGDGRTAASVGKLSLADYATLLLSSRVGVSLMASPHPSYPPLEMATMGLRTVTNRFTSKDLADWHPNIVSVGSVGEAELAAAIAQACRLSETPPTAAPNPEFVREDKYPFLRELAEALRVELPA